MRRRSVSFVIKQMAKTVLRKSTIATLSVVLIVGGAIVGQNILTTPNTAYAVIPPDSCFGFDAGIGEITNYRDYESASPANPACPRSVEIPATIGGVAVTSIGFNAFNGMQITSVTIPSSVTKIKDFAFTLNPMTSVIIPDSVTSIGNYAFSTNQLTSVTIPDNVTSIGNAAFASNKLTSVTISENLTTINDGTFRNNNLTSLTIPSSVTSIGTGAFYMNDISTLVIPDTVTNMGIYVFEANQLTSVTIGCGMSAIAGEAFAMNKLQEVTIPDCITSIDPTSFFGQNPWGGVVERGTDPTHDWYSSDPAIRKSVYDSIWYAQLYTNNPNNPNQLIDGITNENWYTGDINGDGDGDESTGGHLINPAKISLRYVDGSNASLMAESLSTGRLANTTNLSDYLIKNIEVPQLADSQNPTAEEQTVLAAVLNQYYRVGQTVSLTAPIIPGYTLQHPSSPHALNLSTANNNATFTYAISQATPPEPGDIPATPVKDLTPDSDNPKPLTTSTPLVGSTITHEVTDVSAPTAKTAGLARVDFASPGGSATNPTPNSVPGELAAIMAKSNLAVDETKACNQIDSAYLLSGSSFKIPDSDYKTLGGLAFVLNCSVMEGEGKVTFSLGDTIADLSKVKIYKQNSQGASTDITNKVNLTNHTANGHTAISYTIKDGQSLDDDGIINSSITDPIYLAVPSEHAEEASPSSSATIPRQLNFTMIIGAAIIIVAVAGFIIIRRARRV